MRFLNCRDGGKTPGISILEVGVDAALQKCGFDEAAFEERGAIYVSAAWCSPNSLEVPES